MGRSPCCDESGLKKGPWTAEEDHKLVEYIQKHGHGSWRALPKNAGLNRCGKSCRLRWTNYLRPDIKRGKFSQEEEQTILHLHSILGNKWSAIATHLPGRTDNEIKNFWNTHLKKKLIQMGFDPMTHRPRTDLFSNLSQLFALANLREMVDHHPWEIDHSSRIQAEASQMARLQYMQYLLQSAAAMTSSSSSTDMEPMNNFLGPASSSSKPYQFDEEAINGWGNCNYQLLDNAASSLAIDPVNAVHIPISEQTIQNSDQSIEIIPTNFETLSHNHQGSNVLFNNIDDGTPKSSMLMPPTLPFGSTEGSMNNLPAGSGYGSSPIWPDFLLEDSSFIHEVV